MIHRTMHYPGSFLTALVLLLSVSGCKKDADEAGRVMRPIMSSDFPEPIARVPVPAKWKLDTEPAPGEPSAVGPDGIKVYDTPFKGFSFPLDALSRQVYRQTKKEKEKSDAFWPQHRRRLNARQREFEAQQRAVVEANNATNDAIMKGWRDRNEASDRMHDKTIDSIRDEQSMRDPNTGQSYKVEAGSDQYWKNDQGEYIKSDDRFYNPNRDPNVNTQDWNEMEEQR